MAQVSQKTFQVRLENLLSTVAEHINNSESSLGEYTTTNVYNANQNTNYLTASETIQSSLHILDATLTGVGDIYAGNTYTLSSISSVIGNAPSYLSTLNQIDQSLENNTLLASTLYTRVNMTNLYATTNETTLTTNTGIETNRAISVENTLSTTLQSETSLAIMNETILQNTLTTEITRAMNAESTLSTLIEIEIVTAGISGSNLVNSLTTVSTTDLSNGLTTYLNNDITLRNANELTISTMLNLETSRAIAAEINISSGILAEKMSALGRESTFSTLTGVETSTSVLAILNLSTATSTIESLDIAKNGSVAFISNLDANSMFVKNVSSPLTNLQAANKQYVDERVSSLGYVFQYVGHVDPTVVTTLDTVILKNPGSYYKILSSGSLTYTQSNLAISTIYVSTNDSVIRNSLGNWDLINYQEILLFSTSLDLVTVTGSIDIGYVANIATTYVGQSSIKTTGTVTTGTYQASTIKTLYGGTGVPPAEVSTGNILLGTAATSLAQFAPGAVSTILFVSSGTVNYVPNNSSRIALSGTTNFSGLNTTQQAVDSLFQLTQTRRIAQYFNNSYDLYADPSNAYPGLLSGKVNFINAPTTVSQNIGEAYEVQASSYQSTLFPWLAMDHLSTTYWQTNIATGNKYNSTSGAYIGSVSTSAAVTLGSGTSTILAGEWIQAYFSTGKAITKYCLQPLIDSNAESAPTSFCLLGTTNNSNWYVVDSNANLTFTNNEYKTFTLATTSASNVAYRLVVTGVGSSAASGTRSNAQLSAFHLYEEVATATPVISTLSRVVGSGFSASSTAAGSLSQNAFDGTFSTTWTSLSTVYSQTTGAYTGLVTTMPVAPSVDWIVSSNSFNTTFQETLTPFSMAADASGNNYLAYLTTGTLSGQTKATAAGSNDLAVLKYDSAGVLQWVQQGAAFNPTGAGSGTIFCSLAVAPTTGNVYVAYQCSKNLSGQTSSGGHDVVVLKMNNAGVLQWTNQSALVNTSVDDSNPVIGVDASENLYVAYNTAGVISGQTGSGDQDIVVFSMDTAGAIRWVTQSASMNTSAAETTPSLLVDSSANVYVTYVTGGRTLGTNTLTGTSDIAVAKLNTSGVVEWVKQSTTFNATLANSEPYATLDASGNVLVAYKTTGSLSGSTEGGNLVVFKMDPAGSNVWSKQYPNFAFKNALVLSKQLRTDASGNFYMMVSGTV